MGKILLKIVTPEKLLLSEEVDGVSVSTVNGYISILPNHIPLITAVRPGELKIKKGKEEEFFSITKGILETDGKTITLLTDAAERAEEIDEERAQKAMEKAKELMSKEYKDKVTYTEAITELERAVVRIKVAKKRRGGRMPNFEQ